MDYDADFCSMLRASGQAESWKHVNDAHKFTEFGWRCNNKESSYSNDTLIGNWNEERFDIEKAKVPKRLPSQFEHYFESTYNKGYNKQPYKVPDRLKESKGRDKFSFPGHQPELDSNKAKQCYNSYETTSRAAYINPAARRTPNTSNT